MGFQIEAVRRDSSQVPLRYWPFARTWQRNGQWRPTGRGACCRCKKPCSSHTDAGRCALIGPASDCEATHYNNCLTMCRSVFMSSP